MNQRSCLAKFQQNPELKQKLLETGHKELIKGNMWHDKYCGTYMVDKENGKQYVVSAYGKEDILQRWTKYVKTGYGDNKKIKELLNNIRIDTNLFNFPYYKFYHLILQTMK